MNKSDIEKYLINLLKISRIDGVLNPKTEEIIENIRKELGATKGELNQAIRISEKDIEDFKLFGSFSDRVKNLEDMMLLSINDDKITENEKKRINDFSKEINVTQEQLNIIVRETQNRKAILSGFTNCKNCNQKIQSDVNFCPNCGSDLSSKKLNTNEIKLDLNIPNTGITLEFCVSTAATFSESLKLANINPTFQECIRSDKKWYCVSYQEDQMREVLKIVDNLKGIRNRKVYYKGQIIQWDEMFHFLWCFQQQEKAYRPNEYCFGLDEKRLNIWGCKQSNLDWVEWSDWFTYGKFRDKQIFVFDKKRIIHELKTNLYRIRFCPNFRSKYVETMLSIFPDEVKVSDNGLWLYKENYQQTPGSIKVTKKSDFLIQEVYIDGVKPNGFSYAKKLIETAITKCGIKQLDYKGLDD